VSRKYSVLFVALALVAAMAAGAWATSIPSFSGADQTSQPGTMNIDVVGVQVDKATCSPDANTAGRKANGDSLTTIDPYTARPVWWSEDVTVNGVGPVVMPASEDANGVMAGSTVESPFGFVMSGEVELVGYAVTMHVPVTSQDAANADGLLFYLGRGVREVPMVFSGDSTDVRWGADPFEVSADFNLLGSTVFGTSNNSWFTDFSPSEDLRVDQTLKLTGTVCAGGECNTVFSERMAVWENDGTDRADSKICSGDLSMFFYVPCGDYVKDWQVYNRLNDTCWDDRNLMTVYPQDMVRYSNNVVGTHELHVGPYVVETYAGYPSTTGRVDFLVERILNQSGASVMADLRVEADGTTYFNWLPAGQWAYGETQFRNITVADLSPVDTAYLDFQEWDVNRTDAYGNTWYTWTYTTDPAATNYRDAKGQTITAAGKYLDLAPGFARYYMYSADETEEIELCFVDADAREDLCQATTIEPQLWFNAEWCASENHSVSGCGMNNECGQCFSAVVMSADENVRADLAGWTGIEAPEFTAENTACGSCEGEMIQRLDENNYLHEPFASLNACEGSTVCWGASLDVVICDPICDYDLKDIHLTRVTFKIAKNRICDPEVEANITAAIAKLGDDPANKPLNVAPADAILNPASVDATLGAGLDIVVILPDGTKANLVELAKANEYLDATLGYQGIKNYFEAWAQANMSVWEAWNKPSNTDDDEILVSCHVALVNGDAPEGQAAIQAKKGYFLIYTGKSAGTLANPLPGYLTYFALMTGFDPNCGAVTPTPIPEPELIVTSDPSGTSTAVDCATFTKESFSPEAWAAILDALEITNESAYTFSFSGVDCLSSDVAGLTAEQDVTFTVTYEDGIASASSAVTGRNVFVYSVTDAVYDLLPEVAEEVSIATEQTKTTVIAEGSEFDANEAVDALQVSFSLVSVTATANPTTTPSSGGGSGCTFGFAPLALLLLAPLALLKK